jgi:hypothetical protein
VFVEVVCGSDEHTASLQTRIAPQAYVAPLRNEINNRFILSKFQNDGERVIENVEEMSNLDPRKIIRATAVAAIKGSLHPAQA